MSIFLCKVSICHCGEAGFYHLDAPPLCRGDGSIMELLLGPSADFSVLKKVSVLFLSLSSQSKCSNSNHCGLNSPALLLSFSHIAEPNPGYLTVA